MELILAGLLLSIGWHLGASLIEPLHMFDGKIIRKIKETKMYKTAINDSSNKQNKEFKRYTDTRMGFKP